MGRVLSTRHPWRLALVAVALLGSVSGAVLAEDAPAVFDAKQCQAAYPERARQNKEEGDIALSVLVMADGTVKDVKIEKSTGFRELDKAGVVAISRCKLVPASKDGNTVESWTTVRYSWKL